MTPTVIMAGGRGQRLHPLTEKTPKPMLTVGGKPILETVMEGFAEQGFKKFWLCLGYRAELIQRYFQDGTGRGWRVRYTVEPEPLGTAGPLSLLPEFNSPFIVGNADVLTKLSYGKLMEHHARSNADATVCLALWQHQIPYGVAQFGEDGLLTAVQEKPIEGVPVVAGIYVLNPLVVKLIPKHTRIDMPDLLKMLDRVSGYVMEGHWQDVGRFEDLSRANGEMAPIMNERAER